MKIHKEEEEEIVEDNKSGYFFNYFSVVQRIHIKEIN